jgi:hypothetical protein
MDGPVVAGEVDDKDRVPGRGVRSGRWVIVSGKLERVSLQPLAG